MARTKTKVPAPTASKQKTGPKPAEYAHADQFPAYDPNGNNHYQAANSVGVRFPRIRVMLHPTLLHRAPWLWTPELKQYVVDSVQESLAGQKALAEWIEYGNGAKDRVRLLPGERPRLQEAFNFDPSFREAYRQAFLATTIHLEERIINQDFLSEVNTYRDAYGNVVVDPASVKHLALRMHAAEMVIKAANSGFWRPELSAQVVLNQAAVILPPKQPRKGTPAQAPTQQAIKPKREVAPE